MTRKRQAEKSEATKQLILDTAKEIIQSEGFEKLSIRKIVHKIDYSPAIIYHYFRDKNEIVETLMQAGFQNIVGSLRAVAEMELSPNEELKETLKQYIRGALDSPMEYKTFMTKDDDLALQTTALLHEGASEKPSVRMLCGNLQRGITAGIYRPCDVELTAQIIWTSTFGLILKLIIERHIPQRQIERLIDQHIAMLYGTLLKERGNE